MTNQINKLRQKIEVARKEMERLWDLKQRTDPEVLKAAEKVDKLLNEYSELLEQNTEK
ncbi:Spo0E like sporulation regulatory protein [Hydrogenispora ethanolica]|uniref:Spo0E like sporulation regulatory protein n=1 Tax=Hydrogenispora ethanolica TaxID=1082276 RepID=A0A4R1S4S8_HYDET|nr:aspartyl-phosphate phosphatase Spo0E family protein [Hydrogenispora ethanolica]TCL74221.1 Spo0E like sporulation regulatory protein [Hydrogenispora ethanolica]